MFCLKALCTKLKQNVIQLSKFTFNLLYFLFIHDKERKNERNVNLKVIIVNFDRSIHD